MFTQLTIDQIASLWDFLSPALLLVFEDNEFVKGQVRSDALLEAFLAERMECWVSYIPDDNNKVLTLISVFAGTVLSAFLTNEREYLILAATPFVDISAEGEYAEYVKEAFSGFLKHATKIGCKRVVGYSKSPRVMNLFKNAKGDILTRYMCVEVL